MNEAQASERELPTLAWFHCFSGIAGDMALGALIDAGASLDEVRAICDRLPISGWRLEAEPVLRGGVAGTSVRVVIEQSSVVRTAAHIHGLIEEARLPDRVRQRALGAFDALAALPDDVRHRTSPSTLVQMFMLFHHHVATMDRKSFGRIGTDDAEGSAPESGPSDDDAGDAG